MGWDAFGLPAENAAIQRGVSPADWTKVNIADMKRQLQALGVDFDWDRELRTCDPSYYKHTQRIFQALRERGMAYREETFVNWDPVDQTVLANEQIDSEGRSWRSGAQVQKRKMNQWYLDIKKYAQEMLDGVEGDGLK